MEKVPENMVYEIIYMPQKFHQFKNISFRTLLEETGYFKEFNVITELSIMEELLKHPEVVSDWLSWSEDKRTTSGWYFKHQDSREYIVAYYPSDKKTEKKEYSDVFKACADFIKKEIEEIRNHLKLG